MKNNAVYKFVALAASVAIAGCVAPGSLTKVDTASTGGAASIQAAQQTGGLQLNVHWPQRGGFKTQDIPNRAEKVIVTLTDKNGALLGQKEAVRSPYGYMDTYSSNFSWNLPQQEGVTVKAELFDAANASVGSAQKVIDVVAGHNAYVALDIVIDGAPTVSSLDRTSFRIDDEIIIKGTGFGKTQGYQAMVYLESEGVFSNAGSPFPYHYNYQVNLPASAITSITDTEIKLKVPDQMEYYGRLTDRLWNYFHGDDTQKLYLGVVVDGVNSNRLEVSMPKVASASVTVRLEQGKEAPAHVPVALNTLHLASSSYAVPIASGTQWTFRYTQDWGYEYGSQYSQPVTVRLTDDDGQADVVYETWSTPMDLLPYNSNDPYEPELAFLLRLRAMGQIQNLGDEEFLMPDGYQRLATHLFYNLPSTDNGGYSQISGRTRDVWVVPQVGVVRMVETQLVKSDYDQNVRREVKTYELTGFQPAGSSVQ